MDLLKSQKIVEVLIKMNYVSMLISLIFDVNQKEVMNNFKKSEFSKLSDTNIF